MSPFLKWGFFLDIYTYMKFEQLLVEINKKDILIQKLGFNEFNAAYILHSCGALSVWIGNKLIEREKDIIKITEKNDVSNQEAVGVLNTKKIGPTLLGQITSIMDWVRVDFNGNISPIKDKKFVDLYYGSKEWHDNLQGSGGDIDYKEQDRIIEGLDFRKNGIGYYWVDLETTNSDKECNRMGHCGRTSYGDTLVSFREVIKLNDKHTKNVSHLTAAVSEDGILYQLKGQKNNKPKPEYYPYIIPFLLSDYVKIFGSEYSSKDDFKIKDLPVNDVKVLYEKKPELFNRYSDKKLLTDMGIIEKIDTTFMLKCDSDDVDTFVDGDISLRTFKYGDGILRSYTMFQAILNSDYDELYNDDGYKGDWKDALNYHTDVNNKKKIWEKLQKISQESDITLNPEESLEDVIESIDDDHEIRKILSQCQSDCHTDNYYNHVYNTLKKCLEQLGEVIKMNDEGIEIKIDFENLTKNISREIIDEYMEECDAGGDISITLNCVLGELLSNEDLEKPKFQFDNRWYPDVDNNLFNEYLKDRLDEI